MYFLPPAYAEAPTGEHTAGEPASGHEGATGEHAASEQASGKHASGPNWHELSVSIASLLVFLAILYAVARQPVTDALRSRAQNIRKSIDEANAMQAEAQSRFEMVAKRLAGLDAEVASLKNKALEESQSEAARLRERASQDALRIQEVAERTIREETDKARRAIREEAVKLAVELARTRTEQAITTEDQRRFTREFLGSIQADRGQNG
jgi:F-type H+-transporting ATPase subunit b